MKFLSFSHEKRCLQTLFFVQMENNSNQTPLGAGYIFYGLLSPGIFNIIFQIEINI